MILGRESDCHTARTCPTWHGCKPRIVDVVFVINFFASQDNTIILLAKVAIRRTVQTDNTGRPASDISEPSYYDGPHEEGLLLAGWELSGTVTK